MTINKIIKNNSVNKTSFESMKNLSEDEKIKLLNIFNFIDEKENDNLKGVITTDEALNSFLKEVRNSLGERYNQILDSIGLSHLKNDRNINGIIDIEDFSKEDLIKLENNKLLDIFDIEKIKDQKWSPEFSKIISAILHNTQLEEKIITTSFLAKNKIKSIIFDTEAKTLKKAEQTTKDGPYSKITKYMFDEKGFLKQELSYSDYHKYLKDGEIFIIGPTLNGFAEVEGFPSLNSENLTEQTFNTYKEALSKTQFGDKIEYTYDKNGKITKKTTQRLFDNKIVISKTMDNITESITTDLYGNVNSHVKNISLIDTKSSKKYISEHYDKDGQLIYTITKEAFIYNEPIMITDKNGNNVMISIKEQTIKEYPDGKVEKEEYYE